MTVKMTTTLMMMAAMAMMLKNEVHLVEGDYNDNDNKDDDDSNNEECTLFRVVSRAAAVGWPQQYT